MKAGVVSFGMPPVYNRIVKKGGEDFLNLFLKKGGYEYVRVQINSANDLEAAVKELKKEDVQCLIFDMKHWGRNALIVHFARRMDLPLAIFCHTEDGLNGVTITTSVSGVLREMEYSKNVNLHERFTDKMMDDFSSWLKGVDTLAQLKKSRVLCWGGSYGADMPYTRSDPDGLENLLIAEVMVEPEKNITDKAAEILANHPERIEKFWNWVRAEGGSILYDEKMVNEKSLAKQGSLYLAARDRLKELGGENIKGISIKCHFELSITDWGCTACTLPAFLPFGFDSEGEQTIVPTACEGDLNGLIGLLILQNLNSSIPPLFGDLVEYRDDYVLLRNCGASSIYWAGLSNDPSKTLPFISIKPNMHGNSGAAVSYETPEVKVITILRLFRLKGRFCIIYGKGKIIAETEESRYGDCWPHTRLDLGVENDLLFKVFPCNHASLTAGDHTMALETICKLSGIKGYRCDSEAGLRALFDLIHSY